MFNFVVCWTWCSLSCTAYILKLNICNLFVWIIQWAIYGIIKIISIIFSCPFLLLPFPSPLQMIVECITILHKSKFDDTNVYRINRHPRAVKHFSFVFIITLICTHWIFHFDALFNTTLLYVFACQRDLKSRAFSFKIKLHCIFTMNFSSSWCLFI